MDSVVGILLCCKAAYIHDLCYPCNDGPAMQQDCWCGNFRNVYFTCFHSAELGADTDSPFLQPNSNYLYSVNFWQYYSAKYEYITRSTIPSKQNIQYSPNNNKNHSYKPWFTNNAKQHYIYLSSAFCGHNSFAVLNKLMHLDWKVKVQGAILNTGVQIGCSSPFVTLSP